MDTKDLLKKYEPEKATKVIAAEPQIRGARFSPCGKLLVAGGFDSRVRRWKADDQAELPALEGHHAWIDGIAFRAEGELLFTADSWGQLRCWAGYTADQPQVKWQHEQAHDGWIRQLAVSPDGKLLASCGADKVVRVWSIEDGKKQHELASYGQDILSVCWGPEGTLLSGDDRGIVKRRKLDGSLVREFNASVLYLLSRLQDVGGAFALAIDKEGKQLVVAGTTPSGGGTVQGIPTILVFDLATGKELHKLTVGANNDCYVGDLHLHPEGFISAVTFGTPGQGQLLYVRPEEKTPFFTKKMSNAHSLSWHPDGRRVAVVTTNPGSNGNGRPLDKDGNYKTNSSPITVFTVPGEPVA
jgi:WD40 repeat protein